MFRAPLSRGERTRLGSRTCRQLDRGDLCREFRHARERSTMHGPEPSSRRPASWPARYVRDGPGPASPSSGCESGRALHGSRSRRVDTASRERHEEPTGRTSRKRVRAESPRARGRPVAGPSRRGASSAADGRRDPAVRYASARRANWRATRLPRRLERVGSPISGHGRCARTRFRRSSRRPASIAVVTKCERRRRCVESAELSSRRRIVHGPEDRLARTADGRQGHPVGANARSVAWSDIPKAATRLRATGSQSSIGPLPMIASRLPCGLNRISRVLDLAGGVKAVGNEGESRSQIRIALRRRCCPPSPASCWARARWPTARPGARSRRARAVCRPAPSRAYTDRSVNAATATVFPSGLIATSGNENPRGAVA